MSDQMNAVVSEEMKALGDRISELSLKQAKVLSDYLKDVHHIEPASGVAAPPPRDEEEQDTTAEPTEFNVILTSVGQRRLEVVKAVKALTGASLMDARKMIEATPATIKEQISKDDAEQAQADLRQAGAEVELQGVA